MAGHLAAMRFLVDGMSCAACEQRIEKAVGALEGVGSVHASAALSEVMVYLDPALAHRAQVEEAIRGAGYTVREESQEERAEGSKPGNGRSLYRLLGLLAVVAAIYLLLKYAVGFTFLPAVTPSMGYGLLFVVGLLTSLHCIAMCGGIVLSQGVRTNAAEPGPFRPRLTPSLLYNGGRVVSYTVIGGTVGALGSLFSLSTALKGAMPVVAGAFMLFLGVRMLGIIPWLSRLKIRLPGVGGTKLREAAAGRGPFVIGLLNGLMPCGPLQTMQVYALGTGGFVAGALSMFLFSLGTVPLLLGFGAITSLLSAKLNRRMVTASGVLVMALGLVMFTRGMSLFGVALPEPVPGASNGVAVASVNGAVQEVRTTVAAGAYQPFIVQKGIPVRWTISVKAEDINGCNSPVTVPAYGIRRTLAPGDNLVQFMPDREGTIVYTCWMGMITSTIRVVDDLAKVSAANIAEARAAPPPAGSIASAFGGGAGATGGCCATTPARFAGGKIPTDSLAIATSGPDGQVAEVRVDADGYTPAVVVLQKGMKARIRFLAGTLTGCNSIVDFPEYQGRLDLGRGQLETPPLDVSADFTFQCGMGMLHGYVKVVDDISTVNVAEVKRQVAAFKPAVTAASCCGR